MAQAEVEAAEKLLLAAELEAVNAAALQAKLKAEAQQVGWRATSGLVPPQLCWLV